MWKAIGAALAAALVVGGMVYWVMQDSEQPVKGCPTWRFTIRS